jgi:branched-chain amino acid transport system ATP-binding protein
MTPPLLELASVSARYGLVQVLWGASISVGAGETVALVGPNGAGKSSLLRAIAGAIEVFEGDVLLEGESVRRLSSSKRLRSGVAWVPEGRELFPRFSVEQNLYLSARVAGCPKKEFPARLADVGEIFPFLGDRLRTPAGALSGGEQQMVAIARAIVRNPRVILLDEPSAGLAPIIVKRLGEAVTYLQGAGVAVLVAEQNVGWLTELEGRAYTIRGGHVLESGSIDLLKSRDAIRAAYLGGDPAV